LSLAAAADVHGSTHSEPFGPSPQSTRVIARELISSR